MPLRVAAPPNVLAFTVFDYIEMKLISFGVSLSGAGPAAAERLAAQTLLFATGLAFCVTVIPSFLKSVDRGGNLLISKIEMKPSLATSSSVSL